MAPAKRTATALWSSLASIPRIDLAAPQRNDHMLNGFSRDELAMLELARRWAPYGGVHPHDVLVEFGLTKPEFDLQLRPLLTKLSPGK